jgi:hypothetical protein
VITGMENYQTVHFDQKADSSVSGSNGPDSLAINGLICPRSSVLVLRHAYRLVPRSASCE